LVSRQAGEEVLEAARTVDGKDVGALPGYGCRFEFTALLAPGAPVNVTSVPRFPANSQCTPYHIERENPTVVIR